MLVTVLSILLSIFRPPVDYDISLAGNFGEPRPHHFHGGLDIRTGGVEGKPICAIGDGYVSRVTCGLYGFGNAVYITHPTGQTSIYCHLKSFSPRIKAALRRYQYEHQTSVADAVFSPLELPVSQGQHIALSGNTGHSTAPHLHLEIRDTHTWDMLDPYEFLSDFINDTIPPRAHGFMACPQDRHSSFCGSSRNQTFGFANRKQPTRFTAWGRVGFALCADDYMQDSPNHYGIRETHLLVDGREVFSSRVDRIPDAHNRMVNSWGDYDHWQRHRVWYMRSYIEPGNTLPILTADERRGIVDFCEARDYQVEYILRDYQGNEARYAFTVKGVPSAGAATDEQHDGQTLFRWDQTNSYSVPGMQLIVPYGLLANDVWLQPQVKSNNQLDALSDAYTFNSRSLPLLSAATLSISVQSPVEDPSKLYIASGGRFMGGDYEEGWVRGQLRELGAWYQLDYDDEPPQISPVSLDTQLVLNVTDAKSGIAAWTATVDGRFIVFDAVEKTHRYACDLRETWLSPSGSRHRLLFTATDNRQNSQTYEATFTY